jgi:bacteriorhodopsin
MIATGQGIGIHHINIHHSHEHVPDTETEIRRQVFWARYVDWALTTPLILLELGILAGMSGAHILMAVIADIIMILMGLFAAFGNEKTPQKWGDYTIAILAFLVVVWHLGLNGRNAVKARSQNVASFYTAIAAYTVVVWAAYAM